MVGGAEVAANDKNANVPANLAVDHGVREGMQWVRPTGSFRRPANPRKLDKQLGNALDVVQEAVRELRAALSAIELRRLQKIKFRTSMEAVGHPRLARMRATASEPGTSTDGSASASASRLAAR